MDINPIYIVQYTFQYLGTQPACYTCSAAWQTQDRAQQHAQNLAGEKLAWSNSGDILSTAILKTEGKQTTYTVTRVEIFA